MATQTITVDVEAWLKRLGKARLSRAAVAAVESQIADRPKRSAQRR